MRVIKCYLLNVSRHGNDEKRAHMAVCTRSTRGHVKAERKRGGKKKGVGVGRREGVRVERREGIGVGRRESGGECNLNALYMNKNCQKMWT